MTTLREAAQQALEALEDHATQYPHMQKGYTVDAITALRAALAEEALQRITDANQEIEAVLEQPEQEPVDTEAALRLALDQRDWAFKQLQAQHPRREWRGLTEEEIYPLYSEPSSDAEMVEFARAIEAALRSKNHE